ncbi:MAG TPA: phospholipase A [Acidobacteriota bacterium]|nr:phospholipase A [Acidobacteriota bacterium]
MLRPRSTSRACRARRRRAVRGHVVLSVALAGLFAWSAAAARAASRADTATEPETGVLHTGSPDSTRSALSRLWELEARTRMGTFLFRPHRPNYVLLGRYSSDPNDRPITPTRGAAPEVGYDNIESKFQLSFKMKAAEGLFDHRVDLWFGYTQQSHWQVYNGAISRPFRETDHEPEFMIVAPVVCDVGPLRLRFLNLGLVHQSNGRSNPESRSWNRVYLQAGFERGRFALLARPWYRFPESRDVDDNDDIQNYVGRGDLLAIYGGRTHTLAMLVRNSLTFRNNRGSVQLDWSFPVASRLRGYVQAFSGHGESLVDYNHRQTTIGLGVMLTDWILPAE